MRIQDGNLTGAGAESGRAADVQRLERDSSVRSGGAHTSPTGDRVELSSTLSSLSRSLSAFSSDRSSRVQALASRYQAGDYRVDPMATSRGLIADALAAGLK